MTTKTLLALAVSAFAFSACETKKTDSPLVGTWELVSATTIEKDSSFSTFDPTHKMIKIINPTHFAFLNHAISPNDSASNEFTGGGGKYTLVDSVYTEHLDYYVDKAWENHTFEFVVDIKGDTLTQKGVEKLDKLGIDRIIIEKYIRVKN